MAQEALKRDEVLALLRTHRQTLAERFGVSSVHLFGSVARDRATPASDVDILVSFDGRPPCGELRTRKNTWRSLWAAGSIW